MHRFVAAILVGLFTAIFPAHQASSDDDLPIAAFYGTYEGTTRTEEGQGLPARQVLVSIEPREKGFRLSGKTIIPKKNGKTKETRMSVNFRPTRRPGVYVSAMRKDMFGNEFPLDPLKGDPFMWSQVTGDTLYTYGMQIGDNGASELQIHERTRTKEGMELRFYRFADGWLRRAITGTLREVER